MCIKKKVLILVFIRVSRLKFQPVVGFGKLLALYGRKMRNCEAPSTPQLSNDPQRPRRIKEYKKVRA